MIAADWAARVRGDRDDGSRADDVESGDTRRCERCSSVPVGEGSARTSVQRSRHVGAERNDDRRARLGLKPYAGRCD